MGKLIILEVTKEPKPNVRVCYWADVPVAHQPHIAAIQADPWVSGWIDTSAQELTDLRSGAVRETVLTHEFEAGTSLADMKTVIETEGIRVQNEVTSDDTWQYYGTWYDGSWHQPGT